MLTATPQKTALYETHVALGAKTTDFHGWLMPLQYTKVLEEHQAVRERAGAFDISHMGLLLLDSEVPSDTWAALDALLPQNMQKLVPGKAVYTQFLNEAGGILDDVIVYKFPESNLTELGFSGTGLIICNASNREKIGAWLGSKLPTGVRFREINETHCLLALQGPETEAKLQQIGLPPGTVLPSRFHLLPATLSGIPVMLCRTGYTGEDGVEMIVPMAHVAAVWTAMLAAGVAPCGLAARDTLRLESAYALYGQDIDETTSPIEAGLGWSVPKSKESDYIGKSVIEAHRVSGGSRQFICFEMAEGTNTIPRSGHSIYINDQEVGQVTSGGFGPTLNKAIGMGYVTTPSPILPGAIVQIHIRHKMVHATLTERPFYQRTR